MISKFIYFILFTTQLFASGAYDNGTSTGKGKFKFDLTWNPFDLIDYGQSYIVSSYGLTDKLDFHGYLSKHPENYYSYYFGIFYQFYKSDKIDIASSIGLRKNTMNHYNHIFFPQLLYSVNLNESFYLGGSVVNVFNNSIKSNLGNAIDIGIFYKTKIKSNNIDALSFGISAFKATSSASNVFYPTYSIDITFN